MKITKKQRTFLTTTTPILLSTGVYAHDYEVKKGDIFTKIVEREAIANTDLSYQQMLKKVLELNGNLSLAHFDNLETGTIIKLLPRKQLSVIIKNDPEFYTVKSNDTFTNIVQELSRKYDDISYNKMLSLVLKVNEKSKLSEFDRLSIGQKILLPSGDERLKYIALHKQKESKHWTPRHWRVQASNKYIVELGDTLSSIAKQKISSLNIYGEGGALNLLYDLNPKIKRKNKIFAGQEIILPSQKELADYISRTVEDKRVPASKPSIRVKNSNEEVGPQVYVPDMSLECKTSAERRCYDFLNKRLLRSVSIDETKTILNRLVRLSSEYKHKKLNFYFSNLISLVKNSDNEKQLLESLNKYFIGNYDKTTILKMS